MVSFLSTNEYQTHNFHTAILKPCHLRNVILNIPPWSGQNDGLEIIRFKTPYLYNQTGFNNEAYKGFLIFNQIERFDQDDIKNMWLKDANLENTHKLSVLWASLWVWQPPTPKDHFGILFLHRPWTLKLFPTLIFPLSPYCNKDLHHPMFHMKLISLWPSDLDIRPF